MAIQNISGADSVQNTFNISTTEALKRENSPKEETLKDETISKQISDEAEKLKDTTKGNAIDTSA
jgi:hypothetical protein